MRLPKFSRTRVQINCKPEFSRRKLYRIRFHFYSLLLHYKIPNQSLRSSPRTPFYSYFLVRWVYTTRVDYTQNRATFSGESEFIYFVIPTYQIPCHLFISTKSYAEINFLSCLKRSMLSDDLLQRECLCFQDLNS